MAKAKTRVGILRAVIKEVIGKERYSNIMIYVDKQAAGHRFKMVFDDLTEAELLKVTEVMRDEHGIEVTVTSGCSGSRMLGWTAFFVPFE